MISLLLSFVRNESNQNLTTWYLEKLSLRCYNEKNKDKGAQSYVTWINIKYSGTISDTAVSGKGRKY